MKCRGRVRQTDRLSGGAEAASPARNAPAIRERLRWLRYRSAIVAQAVQSLEKLQELQAGKIGNQVFDRLDGFDCGASSQAGRRLETGARADCQSARGISSCPTEMGQVHAVAILAGIGMPEGTKSVAGGFLQERT